MSCLHLAFHSDSVVCAALDVPLEQRDYPRVRLIGWKPLRDVPFDLPVHFERKGDARVLALSSARIDEPTMGHVGLA